MTTGFSNLGFSSEIRNRLRDLQDETSSQGTLNSTEEGSSDKPPLEPDQGLSQAQECYSTYYARKNLFIYCH